MIVHAHFLHLFAYHIQYGVNSFQMLVTQLFTGPISTQLVVILYFYFSFSWRSFSGSRCHTTFSAAFHSLCCSQ